MSRNRAGLLCGVTAYLLWGLLPLYWPLLEPAKPVEILAHRILWSLLVVAGLLAAWRGMAWFRRLTAQQVRLLALASVLVAVNWGTYIYGVNSERVVETSLGYFINPLVTVALGVVFLKEGLRKAQAVAVGIALVAVLVLTIDYGRLPMIALVLAGSWAMYGFIKKRADVDAVESLSVETAILAAPAAAYLLWLGTAGGGGTWTSEGAGHMALLVAAGITTAVPLLFFGAAAVRIPLVSLGLLQYLAPTLQFLIGVVVYGEAMPASRLAGFALVWLALVIFAVDVVRAVRPRPLPAPVEAGVAG